MSQYDAPWHPIMKAREYAPGQWIMDDASDHPDALVDLVRRGQELGYRATSWAADPGQRQLIGYYKTLRAACEAVQMRQTSRVNRGPAEPVQPGHSAPVKRVEPPRSRPPQEVSPGKANTPALTERD